ncbi:hypothetical protein GF357_00925 [Candidatus Dojkabacteria bacterium]|nr:hypothetical protein [Candidatus Dojkabacteria bacterium]
MSFNPNFLLNLDILAGYDLPAAFAISRSIPELERWFHPEAVKIRLQWIINELKGHGGGNHIANMYMSTLAGDWNPAFAQAQLLGNELGKQMIYDSYRKAGKRLKEVFVQDSP